MKALRAKIRRFLWETFNDKLSYHAYGAGDVAGFAGYYKLWGMLIAFDEIGDNHRQPHFVW